jgi:hypothetical protein
MTSRSDQITRMLRDGAWSAGILRGSCAVVMAFVGVSSPRFTTSATTRCFPDILPHLA